MTRAEIVNLTLAELKEARAKAEQAAFAAEVSYKETWRKHPTQSREHLAKVDAALDRAEEARALVTFADKLIAERTGHVAAASSAANSSTEAKNVQAA